MIARRSMTCAGAEDRGEIGSNFVDSTGAHARPSPHAAVKKDDQPASGVGGQRFTKHG